MNSPYLNKDKSEWLKITEGLIQDHPLTEKEIVNVVLQAWTDIFKSKIGGLSIGKELHPSPQIMSFLMHELIPYKLSQLYPNLYRVGNSKTEKDIHCITNINYSIEVKASSSSNSIFANRSYAQPDTGNGKKNKNGYYITINFKKFVNGENANPQISKIRFGYLEHTDWKGQKAETGQQASLSKDAYDYKLKVLYPPIKKV
jgi:hypothetical protein